MALLLVSMAGCLLGVATGADFKATARGRQLNPDTEYYWPHARGSPGHYSITDYRGPTNLTQALLWSWHHPDGRYHTTIVGAPLMDNKYNIYLATEDGIRKFSPSGAEMWHYKPPHAVPTCPSLMDGAVFGNTVNGEVFAVDMATGKELWIKKHAENVGGDTAYVESYEGVVFTGLHSGQRAGNIHLVALDAKTGRRLWQYESDEVLWNVMPVFAGDNSAIVMDIHGGVHKVSTTSGELIWKTSPPANSKSSFSDGGVILGPDGTSYTCSNIEGGQEGSKGALRAFRLIDGKMLWNTELDKPCNSWPVVSPDGKSVVVPTGAFIDSPSSSNPNLLRTAASTPEDMHNFSLNLGDNERRAFGMPEVTASIHAFNAKTGKPEWTKDLPPYGRVAARGDEEGIMIRRSLGIRDQCLPAQFNSPTIAGDNTIYLGRADGKLYAIHDAWGHGDITTFDTGSGFLHPGVTFGPGVMAVASCDGLFVFSNLYKYGRH